MVRFQRTARARGGKIREAVAFAKTISAYVHDKYLGAAPHVLMEQFGEPDRIHWVIEMLD